MRKVTTLRQLCAAMFFVCAAARTSHAGTIAVPAGGNLQAALNAAVPGDTIVLAQGATYVGNFTLPNKSGGATITLQSVPDGLPPQGARISPAFAGLLAKLRSPNSAPALATAPGAHNWRIQLLEFQANAGGFGDIITLGDGSSAQTSLAQVPHDIAVDRCYIHGDPSNGQKRGIALNSASTSITGSYISSIMAVGQDSQTMEAWNGPGPYLIDNNYLEAAGENLLFGGSDPSIPGLVPSDITVTNNTVAKQPGWRGSRWQVKNLFEIKNARHVTVSGNTFDYNWQAAQVGFAILFTVRNQDGGCPWCQVADVRFENNIVRHSAAAVSILGTDDLHPSLQTQAIVVRNNLFADIDNANWGGNGYFLQLLGSPRNVVIDHNTVISENGYGVVTMDGGPILEFTFTNNLVRHNAYGIIGANHSPGNDSIGAFLPGSLVARNVIADAPASRYPGGNWYPSSADFRSLFVSYAGGDYRLAGGSPLRGGATDGADVGANLGAAPSSGSAPGAPGNLSARASGSSVTLTWSAPASGGAPSTYIVEAGSSPGGTNLANFSTGSSSPTFSASNVGAGTYYVRVRAANGAGASGASNEAVLTVGQASTASCSVRPDAPTGLAASVSGHTVVLSWNAAGGAPASYMLEAGSATGGSNLANANLQSAATRYTATGVGSGRYYVRVRGVNACGAGGPSGEVVVVVP